MYSEPPTISTTKFRRWRDLITAAPTPRGTKSLVAICFTVRVVGRCSQKRSSASSSGTVSILSAMNRKTSSAGSSIKLPLPGATHADAHEVYAASRTGIDPMNTFCVGYANSMPSFANSRCRAQVDRLLGVHVCGCSRPSGHSKWFRNRVSQRHEPRRKPLAIVRRIDETKLAAWLASGRAGTDRRSIRRSRRVRT